MSELSTTNPVAEPRITYPLQVARICFPANINILGYQTTSLLESQGAKIFIQSNGQVHIELEGKQALLGPTQWTSAELMGQEIKQHDTSNAHMEAVIPQPTHYDNNRQPIHVPGVTPAVPRRGRPPKATA